MEVPLDIKPNIDSWVTEDFAEIRLQGRSAHQASVDIRLCKQLCRICRIDGTAVLDTHLLRGSAVIDLRDTVADRLACFISGTL